MLRFYTARMIASTCRNQLSMGHLVKIWATNLCSESQAKEDTLLD